MLEIFPSPPPGRTRSPRWFMRCHIPMSNQGRRGAPTSPGPHAQSREPTGGQGSAGHASMRVTSWCLPLLVPGRARVGVPAGSSMPGGGLPSWSASPGRGPGGSRSGSWRRRGCSGPRPWSWRSPSLRPVPGKAVPRRPSSRCSWAPSCCPGASPARRWPSFASTLRRRSWRPTGASPSGRRSSTSVISGGLRRPSRRRRRRRGWCRTAPWRGPASHCCAPGSQDRPSPSWSGRWGPWEALSCSPPARRPERRSATCSGPRRTSTRSW